MIFKNLFVCAVGFLLTSCMGLSQFEVADDSSTLPRIETEDLTASKRLLPDDFQASRNLVIIAFTHAQKEEVLSWRLPLEAMIRADESVDYLELPTLDISVSTLRSFVFSMIKKGTKDEWLRKRRLPMFVDKAEFMKAVGIVDDKQIAVFVCDREGKILHREQGLFNEEKAEKVKAVLTLSSEKL